MKRLICLAVVAAAVATPAVARDAVRMSHDALAIGDATAAERALVSEARIFPNRPELLLNLAAVYASTGRPAQAASLYQRVLAQRDVTMDLSAERTASAHAIAQVGLRRIGMLQTAGR
jgi:hypothetical protein